MHNLCKLAVCKYYSSEQYTSRSNQLWRRRAKLYVYKPNNQDDDNDDDDDDNNDNDDDNS